ncbi:Immune-associated nucleotide-binding protein 9 [Bulinus truncatus]|nr:Immune-associated nucleotide-binding protein 9 [Bulinus truncatus]
MYKILNDVLQHDQGLLPNKLEHRSYLPKKYVCEEFSFAMVENNITDIDLLIIGKTGNGKSALGNSILRRKAFTSSSRASSVTKVIASDVSLFSGKLIKVVDGPGVGDTDMSKEESMEFFIDAMSRAIAENPRGYHAFLLVNRFGGRFTKEDKECVAFLKNVFGENFVRDFCILVMTCGDNFELEFEGEEKSIQDWCKEQEGNFCDLLNEVEGRVVLFDNRTKDEKKKVCQLTELINIVEHLKFRERRYTNQLFVDAQERRDLAMREAKQPVIQETAFNEISLIFLEIQQLEDITQTGAVSRLQDLWKRAQNLHESIKDYDQGSGLMHDFVMTVQRLQNTIQYKIEAVEKAQAERKREEEMQHLHQEKLNRLREDFERKLDMVKHEDDRRQQLKDHEWKIRQMSDQMEHEREMMRSHQMSQLQQQMMEQRSQLQEMEQCCKDIKAKNEEGIFEKIFGYIVSAVKRFIKFFK